MICLVCFAAELVMIIALESLSIIFEVLEGWRGSLLLLVGRVWEGGLDPLVLPVACFRSFRRGDGVIVHELLLVKELTLVLHCIFDDSLLLSYSCAGKRALDLCFRPVLQWLDTLQDPSDIVMESLVNVLARRVVLCALCMDAETFSQLTNDARARRSASACDAVTSTFLLSLRLCTDWDRAQAVFRVLFFHQAFGVGSERLT